MGWVRVVLAAALAALSLGMAGAAAAASFTDTVVGVETAFLEVSPASEVSRFDGLAAGDLPGRFTAIVTHAPLAAGGTIFDDGDDGDFKLVNRMRGIFMTGEFTGGSVSPVSAEPGCGRQVFDVEAELEIRRGTSSGSGHVDARLTHFRSRVFGTCVTYFATVRGTALFAF